MKIISTAPTRISLFGSATDLPVYYMDNGGMVISMSINIRQRFGLQTDYKSPHMEIKESKNVKFYENLVGDSSFYDAFIDEFNFDSIYLEQTFEGPIESGLGASASAAVALIGAIDKAQDLKMTRAEIAEKAWDIANNKLNLYSGKQDEYAAAFGGFNRYFFTDKYIKVEAVNKKSRAITDWMLLFYTGENRTRAKIQEQLKTLTKKQKKSLDKILETARTASRALTYQNYDWVGNLLHESWEYKKESNKYMTTKHTDKIYKTAIKAGANGGKLCGAGQGGHMMFIAEPQTHEEIIKKLTKLGCNHVDFSIDYNGLEVRRV